MIRSIHSLASRLTHPFRVGRLTQKRLASCLTSWLTQHCLTQLFLTLQRLTQQCRVAIQQEREILAQASRSCLFGNSI